MYSHTCISNLSSVIFFSDLFCLFFRLFPDSLHSVSFIIFWSPRGCFASITRLSLFLSSTFPFPSFRSYFFCFSSFLSFLSLSLSLSPSLSPSLQILVRPPPPCRTAPDGPATPPTVILTKLDRARLYKDEIKGYLSPIGVYQLFFKRLDPR